MLLRAWVIAALVASVAGYSAFPWNPRPSRQQFVRARGAVAVAPMQPDSQGRLPLQEDQHRKVLRTRGRRAGAPASVRHQAAASRAQGRTLQVADPRQEPAMQRAMTAARRGDAPAALEFARFALRVPGEGGPTGVRECNQLLRELGDHGHIDAMMSLFDAMVGCGLSPTQVTYGTLISRAGAKGQPKLASRCYRDMLRRGLEPDAQTFNSLINAYGKAGDVHKAFAAADAMRRRRLAPTLVTYNTLIDACARGGNVTAAYGVLREMGRGGVRPNERTYSILIHLSARAARVEEAFEWLARMGRAGLAPNAFTYSALINACCKARQLERAFALLREMRTLELQPNVITYTTLLDGCAKARQLPRAVAVFREMSALGVAPNRITCHALFHGCLKQGEVLLAREVLQHMAAMGQQPGAVAFTALLSTASARGANSSHSAATACLLRQMMAPASAKPAVSDGSDGGAADESDATATLGRSLERALSSRMKSRPQFDETLSIVDALLRARVPPPLSVWLRLLSDCSSRQQLERALRRHRRSSDAAHEAAGTAAPALSAAEAQQVSAAIEAARDRIAAAPHAAVAGADERAAGAVADAVADADADASSVAAAETSGVSLGGAAAAATGAWEKGAGGGASASPQPFLAEAGQPASPELQRAFQVFNEMRASGVAPDRAAFNALMDVCARAGDVARAEGAFGEMAAAGIKPDVISYTSLLKACAVSGDVGRAERIFVEMQQRTNHFTTYSPPSSYTFAHLMSAQLRAGNSARVFALLEEMQERGLRPGHAHLSLALQACELEVADRESLSRALRLYEEMRVAGLRLDTRSLLSIDRLCKHHGRPDVAARLRQERSLPPPAPARH